MTVDWNNRVDTDDCKSAIAPEASELPPLPARMFVAEQFSDKPDAYIASQMQAYARAAIAMHQAAAATEDTTEFVNELAGAAKEASDEWIAGFVRQHFGIRVAAEPVPAGDAYRSALAERDATIAKYEAQMLRMATCAGEFARDAATKPTEFVPTAYSTAIGEDGKCEVRRDGRLVGRIDYRESAKGAWKWADSIATKPAASEAVGGLENMNTQSSREYLVDFMEQHFTDKTFHRYIRGEATRNHLAGDFAWRMAHALRRLAAPAAPTDAKSDGSLIDEGTKTDAVVADLAMLVRRLVRKLEKANPGTDLAPQALDYLTRKGLQGSPLREDSESSPQAPKPEGSKP